jgi:hypothetical protein
MTLFSMLLDHFHLVGWDHQESAPIMVRTPLKCLQDAVLSCAETIMESWMLQSGLNRLAFAFFFSPDSSLSFTDTLRTLRRI